MRNGRISLGLLMVTTVETIAARSVPRSRSAAHPAAPARFRRLLPRAREPGRRALAGHPLPLVQQPEREAVLAGQVRLDAELAQFLAERHPVLVLAEQV